MAAWRTILVIILIITSSLFVMFPTEVTQNARAYSTPNTGVVWNMTTLAANSGGAVFKYNTNTYYITRSVTISPSDTWHINDTINNLETLTIYVEIGKNLYIDGTLNCLGTEFNGIVIKKVPLMSGQWGGIHFNASSSGTVINTTLSDAYTGFYINGSSPSITKTTIKDTTFGIQINANGAPIFSDIKVNDTAIDGLVCTDSSFTLTDRSNITTNGRHGIVLKKSSAFINNSDIHNNTGQGIWLVDSTNVIIDNDTFIFANGGGITQTGGIFSENSSFSLKNSHVNNNKLTGINLTKNSTVTIDNVMMYNHDATGIYLNMSDAIISGLNVTNSTVGILAEAGSTLSLTKFSGFTNLKNAIHVRDSDKVILNDCYIVATIPPFDMGYYGIKINRSSNVEMHNITVYDAINYGVQIYNSSVIASRIRISNSGIHALQMEFCDSVSIAGLTANAAFAGDTVHILKSTNVSILGRSVISTSAFFAIFLQKSTLDIFNTTTQPGSGNSLNITGGSTVLAVNTTIEHDRVAFLANDTSIITRYWYFNVYVTTEGGVPIGYATVNVTDQWDKTIYSKTTTPLGHYAGKAFWLLMYESIQNSTGSFYNNTYIVTANATQRKTNTTVVVADQHREIPLWLWYNQPPGNVTNLTPLKTHDDTPSFTWNKSTDPDGDDVHYHVVVSDGIKIVEDTIVPDNHWNVTSPVPYGIYYLNLSAIDDSGAEGNVTQYVVELENNKPTTPTITLTPGTPNTGEDLVMTITVESSDADDDPKNGTDFVRYTVKWYKNNVEQTGLEKTKRVYLNATGATVSSSLTSIGDVWKVEVIPYDGHNTSWQKTGKYGAHSNGTPAVMQVTIGNRAPYVNAQPGPIVMNEDTSDTSSINLKTAFKDPDIEDSDPTETLTFSYGAHPDFTVAIVQSTGAVTITPNPDYYTDPPSTPDQIKFYATDGSNAIASFLANVTVTNVNDDPVPDAIPDQTAWEDKMFVIYFHANDTKDPADTITISHNFTTAIGPLDAADITETVTSYGKKIQFTPDNSMVGNYTIGVTFNDGTKSVDISFKLQIINTNDAPTVPDITSPADNSEFVEETDVSFAGSASDDDTIWGDILTFRWRSDLDGVFGTGTTLNYNQLSVGTHKIYLSVSDGPETQESYITVTITEKEAEVIPNATLVSPSNGTTISSIDKVTLKWTSGHELASSFTYRIYIGTAQVPKSQAPVKTGHDSTSYDYTDLEDGETYYWQVVPTYGSVVGRPSQIFHFDVDVELIRPNPTCKLELPVNDTTVTTLSVELTWSSDHENKADFTYDLYWGETRFNVESLPTANKADITGMSYTVTNLKDKTRYYWTVVPVDLDDTRGICTSKPPVREFYVDTEGGKTDVTVNLDSPTDKSIISTESVVLKWKSSDTGASSYTYKLYISTNANPTSGAPHVAGVKSTEYTYSVADDTTYYWTVIPVSGGDGVCLDGIWSFSVDFDFVEKRELDITGGLDVTIETGKNIKVTLTVKNTGNVQEKLDVDIDSGGLAGITSDVSTITLAADAQQTVTIDLTIPDSASAGEYTVKVKFTPEGETTPLAEETFQVKVTKPKKGGDEKESNMLLIGIILVIVIVIVLVVVMLMMKKKKGGKEEESLPPEAAGAGEPALGASEEPPAGQDFGPGEQPGTPVPGEPGAQPPASPAPEVTAPEQVQTEGTQPQGEPEQPQ